MSSNSSPGPPPGKPAIVPDTGKRGMQPVGQLPFLAQRPPRAGQATAHVCERYACLPPVTDPAELLVQLEQGTGVSWQGV